MSNAILLQQFQNTQNQDDVFTPGCIISQFKRCTPQRQLGTIMPNKAPIDATSGLTNGLNAEITTCHLPYSLDKNYAFAANGHVYKLNLDGTPTQTDLHTRNPAAGSADCYNCIQFGGYIYYAMQSRLGRLTPSTNTFDSNWQTFTRAESSIYHPMWIVNDTLYIGDGDLIAQVDSAGVFTANALDIQPDFYVSALFEWNNQLIIGATSKTNGTTFNEPKHSYCKVFRWNGWSTSFESVSFVPEEGVAGFLSAGGNLMLVTKGNKIKIYSYSEPSCQLFAEVPTGVVDVDVQRQAIIYPMGFHHYAGVPYFAIGGPLSTAGYTPGVYSLMSKKSGSPLTIQLEHSYRGYALQEYATFYCLNSLATRYLMWSFAQADNPLQSHQGIDYVFVNAAQSCYTTYTVRTGFLMPTRFLKKSFRIKVGMANMTSGCTMAYTIYINGSPSSGDGGTMTKDTDRNYFHSDVLVAEASTIQFEFTVTDANVGAVGSSIDSIQLEF